MTPMDVIDFVVEFYGSDLANRALTQRGSPKYVNSAGKRCAFALFVDNPEILIDGTSPAHQHFDLRLRQEVRHLSVLDSHRRFWFELQSLHDTDEYWDKAAGRGLTPAGENFVRMLRAAWGPK